MITVSTKRLLEAIEEADVFTLPDMNEGTEYLYHHLYERLSEGEDVFLSSIDFHAFELEDVEEMRDLYSTILERNEHDAWTLSRSLQGLLPTTTVSAFV
jgi:methionine synthase II (cobalamin-independent)